MLYRNIDEDINLYKIMQKYYDDLITSDQAEWLLEEKGYSKSEIKKAFNDYYLCHVRPNIFLNITLFIFCSAALFFLIFRYFFYEN